MGDSPEENKVSNKYRNASHFRLTSSKPKFAFKEASIDASPAEEI